jgi:hypothetical protein
MRLVNLQTFITSSTLSLIEPSSGIFHTQMLLSSNLRSRTFTLSGAPKTKVFAHKFIKTRSAHI